MAGVVATVLWLATAAAHGFAEPAPAVRWDAPMQVPSPEETSSWFPDLAVDRQGRVHIVWCQTDHRRMNYAPRTRRGHEVQRLESLYYGMWDGRKWTAPRPIAPAQTPIVRNALTVDDSDTLHLLFAYSPSTGYDLYYRQAPAADGFDLGGWIATRLVNSRWNTYLADITTSGSTVHIVYDDAGPDGWKCGGCSNVFYRRSTDRGWTWSEAREFQPNTTGSGHPQIAADDVGNVYVVWSEGFDTRSGQGEARTGVFARSSDGGTTWAEPMVVAAPDAHNTQLAVGANGRGGVMLVWRSTAPTSPFIYSMWSNDSGDTWGAVQSVPGLLARPGGPSFDSYAMAADSAGNIHLLAAGVPSAGATDADLETRHNLYHLVWDGARWSAPLSLYDGPGYPEYPHLVIADGNQLHATWFTRAELTEDRVPHRVWYAHGRADVPARARATPSAGDPRPPLADLQPFALGAVPDAPPAPDDRVHQWQFQAALLIGSLGLGTLVVAVADGVARWRRRSRSAGGGGGRVG